MRGAWRGCFGLATAMLVAGVLAPAAGATVPPSLTTTGCQPPAVPATGYSVTFCDDGVPNAGGILLPNLTGAAAITVPARYQYQGAGADTFTGLPPQAGDAASTPGAAPMGSPEAGTVALDVDLTYPTGATGPLPIVFMMHGCCSGNKTSWEASTVDAAGEKWHYSNAWFASRGYVVVNYTSRGFVDGMNRGSTGENQLDSRSYEINDYQSLSCQIAETFNDPVTGAALPDVDPQKVVATGGSYGGGFAWMALTDPKWSCPAGGPLNMKLAAVAPRYGWTDLAYSLVPTGTHLQEPGSLPRADGCDTAPFDLAGAPCAGSETPFGLPKRSIVGALFGTGAAVVTNHTIFPESVTKAFACLNGQYPFSLDPVCNMAAASILPEFMRERSAYYQNAFFTKIATDSSYRIPVFDAATFTDPLFTDVENRRMINRLRSAVPVDTTYPVQAYYGDYQHFVQNKAKVWADTCGADDHPCADSDYPEDGGGGGKREFDDAPLALTRTGVTSRLNRFIDHYAQPPENPAEGTPSFDVTGELLVCPQNAPSLGVAANEGGPQFTAPTFEGLAPNSLTVDLSGAQSTTSTASPNAHAVNSDPLLNLQANGGRCPVESAPAGPGVASYDSEPLAGDATMLGATRLTADFTISGDAASAQLDARLYDVFPNGTAVMVDRGPRRLLPSETAAGRVTFELHGNGWRFPAGHRVRVELAQDDEPFVHRSEVPSSATITKVTAVLPIREAPTAVTGGPTVTPIPPGAPGPRDADRPRAGRCVNVTRGTARRDVLRGSAFGDRLIGGAGDDYLRGYRGRDCLSGGRGRDVLRGGTGRDVVNGGPGGGRLFGGGGPDRIAGGRGPDRIFGGSGNDFIDVRGGGRDVVRCGRGNDTVRAGRGDRLINCEHLRGRRSRR